MKRWIVAWVLACAGAFLPCRGEVKLASNGATDYTIELKKKATSEERAAAKDLAWHLGEITGAKFTLNGKAPRKIFVGVPDPEDTAPLKPYERRVRTSKNGDVHIYGQGTQGSVFAVYDFLEKFFDCRWYTFYGDMCIPKRSEAVFDKLELSVIPSYDSFTYYGNIITENTQTGSAFRRRARIYDSHVKANEPVPMVGFDYGHVLSRVLPPLTPNNPPGERWPVYPPCKYFAGKEYFKTNPEFFSMNEKGKRVPFYEVCFSNPELRKTLIENYRTVIKNEYKGGPAWMIMDLNDKGYNGAACCYCPECKKLNEKYGTPAGSYWDFVTEACGIFAREYPEIVFRGSAYQITAPLPTNGFKLPRNFLINISPLDESDFLKPYRMTPRVYSMIEALGKFAGGPFRVQLYPTVYRRPLFTLPLVANVNRLVANMRDAHKLGARLIGAEFGCGPQGDMGFNELRVYLLSNLARDVDCDIPALTADFIEHYYGKAAPMMRKYLDELEALELAEKNFMRWPPDHRCVLTYLTPENLLRWQADFDAMEKLTADDKAANLHVRRARTNLDEATMSVWYKFKPGEMPDRDMMYARYKQTLRDSYEDMLRTYRPAKKREERIKREMAYRDLSMYYHYATSGNWRPLPEKFAKLPAGSVKRIVPYICRKPYTTSRLADDPGAAAGLAAPLKLTKKKLHFLFYRWKRQDMEGRDATFFELSVRPDDVRANAGKGYHTYYVGTSRLWRDSQLITNAGKGVGFTTGYLFDAANPEQKYDFYISLKLDADGVTMFCDEMILVKSDKPSTLRTDTVEP